MKERTIITILLALVAMAVQARPLEKQTKG